MPQMMLGLEDYDEGDLYQCEDYNQMIGYQAGYDQPPYQLASPSYMMSGSADLNMRNALINQQNNPLFQHQRIGSSYSQMNLYQEQ